MKIAILGAGHMGAWLVEEFNQEHEVGVYDKNPEKMRYLFRVNRFEGMDEIEDFQPDLLINAVDLPHTIQAFEDALDHIDDNCIVADIASVKRGLEDFYEKADQPFVSTHPMFGPTFANIRDLSNENAVIIKESCEKGKEFFRTFFKNLGLNIYDYSFQEHDEKTAYSLGVPFSASLVFAACMKETEAPGTTFRKHMEIARGLLSEDDYLLSEILFNPEVLPQIEKINSQLSYLTHIIKSRDSEVMSEFLNKLRDNIKVTKDSKKK
ncbi:MAG: prephenate dehydrogenase/arogenate dehydrogenase family protein [Candidatus Marinimicrobia bacterium]|nr:prephenate dehydrogenase/arogenate dehydrogenase family protein [Candidatus Neomarinimicrobiota bacterium]